MASPAPLIPWWGRCGPAAFSSDQETSTAGDGVLDAIVYVSGGQLAADYYTVCYIKAEMPTSMTIIPMNTRQPWTPSPTG